MAHATAKRSLAFCRCLPIAAKNRREGKEITLSRNLFYFLHTHHTHHLLSAPMVDDRRYHSPSLDLCSFSPPSLSPPDTKIHWRRPNRSSIRPPLRHRSIRRRFSDITLPHSTSAPSALLYYLLSPPDTKIQWRRPNRSSIRPPLRHRPSIYSPPLLQSCALR